MLSYMPRFAVGLAMLCLTAGGALAVSQASDTLSGAQAGADSALLAPISLKLNGPTSLYTPMADSLLGNVSEISQSSVVGSANVFPGVQVNFGLNSGLNTSSGGETMPFLWASNSDVPYAHLANGASYVSAKFALGGDLHLDFGTAAANPYSEPVVADPLAAMANYGGGRDPLDQRKVAASFAGLSWDFADWGALGLTGSQTSERNGVLGDYASALFDDSATTTALGVSARVGFGNGWVTTASFNEGVTQLDLRPNALALAGDSIHTRSYGISVAKNGLFGNDALGIAVTRPAQFYGNDAIMLGIDRSLMLGHEHVMLAPGTPETDFELGYVTTFMDGAVALQANAAYQANLAGTNANSLAVVSRAKIRF